MSVPDYESLMLPVLKVAEDGREHSLADCSGALAAQLKLTAADQQEMLPSGGRSLFASRVAWAKTYLQWAGLLVSPRYGRFQVSERGRDVLKALPARIDVKFLEQYPEFIEARRRRDKSGRNMAAPASAELGHGTPEEVLEGAYLEMRAGLASEVLQQVKTVSPQFFERLVVELLMKMGYGGSRGDAGRAVGGPGDRGIDGIISEDRLGLDVVYLQAKKWDGTVGSPEIQKFVGALHGKRARKGVFITTGTFSADSVAYVERIDPRVSLIDGRPLAELMIDFEVGVTTARSFHVKRIDSDYFDEG